VALCYRIAGHVKQTAKEVQGCAAPRPFGFRGFSLAKGGRAR
jgi:hypothetical protein